MKAFFAPILSLSQKLGQSLMIPVAVLPAAGLLVALGRLLQEQESFPFLIIAGKLSFSGGISLFENLPLLFAVGVAIGLSGGGAVSGLAAVAGHFTLLNVLKTASEIFNLSSPINTGVFGGIMVGLASGWIFKKFSQTQLPPFLGFFAGKRLVPILTTLISLILGIVLAIVWPQVQEGIHQFGKMILNSSFGAPIYASIKRLLIPVGLHHVFYPPFLYDFGQFVTETGEIFKGETARYYAGDPTAGSFMGSEYPMMLFGLPAASLAIFLKAEEKKKKAVGGVMLAGALTAIITGISEPIEFSFIFVAPLLFIYHIALTFVSAYLSTLFDIHLGYTFSASVIDLVLGSFNQKNLLYFLFVVGPLTALAYFGAFYFSIGKFNLKTPGREEDVDDEQNISSNSHTSSYRALETLKALGGKDNIVDLTACITRLRLKVKNIDKVQFSSFKTLGASGSVHIGGGNIQIIFGTSSEQLRDDMEKIMDSSQIFSPLKGQILPLTKVPDEVFSQKIMGEGVVIDPIEGTVYAPCDGVVASVIKTNHAVGILANNGAEILIHVGIDSVKMNGEGFQCLVEMGDHVKLGDKLIEFDLSLVKERAKSPLTPVVITNMSDLEEVRILQLDGECDLYSPLFKIRKS